MSEKWYKLDNVSNLFLASHNKRDPRSIRVSCILKEEINADILQQALNKTIALRPQFQVRIRRGFFWHYLEQTNKMPTVSQEDDRPCPILYGENYKGVLHYKVTYYRNRINVDMCHVISDGTGALSFLKLLVFNYLKLSHPGELDDVSVVEGASSDDRTQDSYDHFYDNSDGPIPKTILNKKKKAYHIQSHKLSYNQLQFFEVHMEADKLIKASKEVGVSLTSFIGAQLMIAISKGMPFRYRNKPITISIPVNLRNYYPSDTLRNFFNNVDVSHVFDGSETVEELAKEFDDKLKELIKPEHIKNQMNRYQSIERLIITRMVPLLIKQPVVKFFAKKEAKTVTAVLSNLGQMKVPDKLKDYIEGFTDYCSTEQMFITITSYGNDIVFGIASAYAGTSVIKRLIKAMQQTGTEVVLHSSDVIK